MPIYEFHCNKCNKDFECLLMGSDKPTCPACQTGDVTRLMSACGFVSKGQGGGVTRTAAADSSCSGCTSGSCASCGH